MHGVQHDDPEVLVNCPEGQLTQLDEATIEYSPARQ